MPSSTISSDDAALPGVTRPRVLLVDDHEAFLAYTAAVLEDDCVVVGTARDGVSALAAAAACSPDVVVLDMAMPGMTGCQVASALRAAGSHAAVVFLTIHHEEEFIAAATAAGGLGYVVKSKLASDLLSAIRAACAGQAFVSVIHRR